MCCLIHSSNTNIGVTRVTTDNEKSCWLGSFINAAQLREKKLLGVICHVKTWSEDNFRYFNMDSLLSFSFHSGSFSCLAEHQTYLPAWKSTSQKKIVHWAEGSRLGEWKCMSDRGASCFLWWNSGSRQCFRSGMVVKSSQRITKESEAG